MPEAAPGHFLNLKEPALLNRTLQRLLDWRRKRLHGASAEFARAIGDLSSKSGVIAPAEGECDLHRVAGRGDTYFSFAIVKRFTPQFRLLRAPASLKWLKADQ
jgi:hypothetical protein